MMISHFISTSNRRILTTLFAFISLIFNSNAFSYQKNTFYFDDALKSIYWKCNKDLCTIYLKDRDINPIKLLDNTPAPSIRKLNKNLISMFFSCGSPCNYTIFYNPKKGLSQALEFVIAVDSEHEIAVVAEKNLLVGYKIFDKGKKVLFTINRNWAPTVTLFSVIISAKFNNANLYINYLEGNDFKETAEVIHDLYSGK